MTVGIYALYWEKQDLIYVGQSQDLNRRWSEHKRYMLKGRHTNYKVQKTYNLYGYPEFVLLQECSISELNDLEIYWTKEYDSLNTKHGLNIIEAGSVGYGPNANNSKYSKLQILLVLRKLSRDRLESDRAVSLSLGVNIGLIVDIRSGNSHIWLKYKYPYLYSNATRPRFKEDYLCFSYITGKNIQLISPEGEIYTITNIKKFALENNLTPNHLNCVINGKRKSHRGWKLYSLIAQ